MDKMTVKMGVYEMDVNEDFMNTLYIAKDFMDAWTDSMNDMTDILIEYGSLEGVGYPEHIDLRQYFTILGVLRDMRIYLNRLVNVNITKNGFGISRKNVDDEWHVEEGGKNE